MNFNTVGGRKFVVTVLCNIVSTILLWFGKLDASNFALLVGGVTAAYITGGTIENVKYATNQRISSVEEVGSFDNVV